MPKNGTKKNKKAQQANAEKSSASKPRDVVVGLAAPLSCADPIQVRLVPQKGNWLRENWPNVCLAVFALFSLVVSLVTLGQMRSDRNASHQPELLLNPATFEFSWNSLGMEEWVRDVSGELTERIEEDETGDYAYSLRIPMQFFGDSALEKIPVANVGVGAAKDISFSWDKNNTERLDAFFVEQNPDMSEFCSIGEKATVFSLDNGVLVHTDNPQDYCMMYMLTTNEDNYTIPIPAAYSILIHEIIKSGNFYNSEVNKGPYIFLTVSYSDILGTEYSQHVLLLIKALQYTQESDGSGRATYQIIPSYAKSN